MKFAMKLRTRLFLSISALITVALLGLLLGLVSVIQMAKSQETLIQHNFVTLDLGLRLRQNLGDQLVMMLRDKPAQPALAQTQQQFQALLTEGINHDQQTKTDTGFEQAQADYQAFLKAYARVRDAAAPISDDAELSTRFDTLRNGLLNAHRQALENITQSESSAREHALWVSALLSD
jgi:NtrC-family two-component system sensor histidine kinase KinB